MNTKQRKKDYLIYLLYLFECADILPIRSRFQETLMLPTKTGIRPTLEISLPDMKKLDNATFLLLPIRSKEKVVVTVETFTMYGFRSLIFCDCCVRSICAKTISTS